MAVVGALTPPGGGEFVVILATCVLLFGAKKLPELGSSLGSGIRSFKRSLADVDAREGEDAPGDGRGGLEDPTTSGRPSAAD